MSLLGRQLVVSSFGALLVDEPVHARPTLGTDSSVPGANLFVRAVLEEDGDRYTGHGQVLETTEANGHLPLSSKRFLEDVANWLVGRSIEFEGSDDPIAAVSRLLDGLETLAQEHLAVARRNEPFHAIRVALVESFTSALTTATAGGNPAVDGTWDQTFYDEVLPRAAGFIHYPEPERPTHGGLEANTYSELDYLLPLGINGTKGHLLERQALARGLSTVRFSKGTFIARDETGERPPLNFKWSRSPVSSSVAIALCSHKEATRDLLSRHGIPVPRGRMFPKGDYEAALTFADRIGYPVVCKPATGVRGIGVVANIQDPENLRRAFQQYEESRLGNDDFIVEQHVAGQDYRIVVIEDRVVAAILREPASVIGDGQRTIAELILHKNAVRRLNPHLWGRPIKFDDDSRHWLKRQQITLASVPERGRHILLSSTCSLSQGGDSIDVLDELDPSIVEAAVKAVKAVPGMGFCGVDFLLEDHRKPINEQNAAGICELNAHAAIGNGEYPMFGKPRQVAEEFFALCARRYGYEIEDPPLEELSLHIAVRGRVTGVGYRNWFEEHALRFGVNGWIQDAGRRLVEIRLQGPTVPASSLASMAALGPRSALPKSVRTRHVPPEAFEGFQIRA